jgi:hypothetical protein
MLYHCGAHCSAAPPMDETESRLPNLQSVRTTYGILAEYCRVPLPAIGEHRSAEVDWPLRLHCTALRCAKRLYCGPTQSYTTERMNGVPFRPRGQSCLERCCVGTVGAVK